MGQKRILRSALAVGLVCALPQVASAQAGEADPKMERAEQKWRMEQRQAAQAKAQSNRAKTQPAPAEPCRKTRGFLGLGKLKCR